MTQLARLLNHLEQRGPITQLEAFNALGVCRLSERVRELESRGYLIEHEDGVEVLDRFGHKCRVTRYRLRGAG